jgi:hypothetical protein
MAPVSVKPQLTSDHPWHLFRLRRSSLAIIHGTCLGEAAAHR